MGIATGHHTCEWVLRRVAMDVDQTRDQKTILFQGAEVGVQDEMAERAGERPQWRGVTSARFRGYQQSRQNTQLLSFGHGNIGRNGDVVRPRRRVRPGASPPALRRRSTRYRYGSRNLPGPPMKLHIGEKFGERVSEPMRTSSIPPKNFGPALNPPFADEGFGHVHDGIFPQSCETDEVG